MARALCARAQTTDYSSYYSSADRPGKGKQQGDGAQPGKGTATDRDPKEPEPAAAGYAAFKQQRQQTEVGDKKVRQTTACMLPQ